MKKNCTGRGAEKGFTLIELIVVIVVLSILAATALPKFIELTQDARRASMEGLAGSVKSASAMAHAKAILSRQYGPTGTITVEGQPIDLVNGYPTSTSIIELIEDMSGYNVVSGSQAVTIDNNAISTATCRVTYSEALPDGKPVITVDVSNCR